MPTDSNCTMNGHVDLQGTSRLGQWHITEEMVATDHIDITAPSLPKAAFTLRTTPDDVVRCRPMPSGNLHANYTKIS